jgi:protein-disulfide isomerase
MPGRPNGFWIVLLLVALAGAQTQPASKSAAKTVANPAPKAAPSPGLPSQEAVNGFLQQTLGWNSTLTWKVEDIRPSSATGLAEVTVMVSGPQGASSSKFYVTPDGQHAVLGNIIPFGVRPFDPAKKALEKGINGPSRGPADAIVTLVEFSDLQCPHCKAAQPTLEKLLAEETNTRLVFQNFPLPGHDWAAKAAGYADCIGRRSSDAFWKFVQVTYDAQTDITAANADEKLNALADAAGAKSAEVAVCAAAPETVERVQHSVDLGKAVEVSGTPMLFVNGRSISNLGGISYDELKALVDFAAKDAGPQEAKAK